MKIDVGDLLKKVGNESRIKCEETLSFPEDGLTIEGPIKADIRLVNVGKSILVDGTIKAAIRLNCVRCLKDFETCIAVPIEEEYSRAPKVFTARGDEVELNDEDFVFKIEEDNSIDLGEAIRQNLLISLPIKPLCKRTCEGLIEAGVKIIKHADPRLAKLKDLLKK